MKISDSKTSASRLPPWIRIRISNTGEREKVAGILREKGLNTVCASAKCPNLGECWCHGTATFMILGDFCTRDCRFCAIGHSSTPPPPDSAEPAKIAEAVAGIGLKHAVVTSVTRDDLPDGGAAAFAETTRRIRRLSPATRIELLIPDFGGSLDCLKTVIDAEPDILNHNLETVRRLTPLIRSGADYDRSLGVLAGAFRISGGRLVVKSGIMLGLGEQEDEIARTIREIRETGASMLTIGQYLRPGAGNVDVARFAHPNEFEDWKKLALELGFRSVWSGPLVRSSYMAEEQTCM